MPTARPFFNRARDASSLPSFLFFPRWRTMIGTFAWVGRAVVRAIKPRNGNAARTIDIDARRRRELLRLATMVAGFGSGADGKKSGQGGGSNAAHTDKLGHHSLHCVGRRSGDILKSRISSKAAVDSTQRLCRRERLRDSAGPLCVGRSDAARRLRCTLDGLRGRPYDSLSWLRSAWAHNGAGSRDDVTVFLLATQQGAAGGAINEMMSRSAVNDVLSLLLQAGARLRCAKLRRRAVIPCLLR
jgi:hypothetical protein